MTGWVWALTVLWLVSYGLLLVVCVATVEAIRRSRRNQQ
jgi:hypothetical protein